MVTTINLRLTTHCLIQYQTCCGGKTRYSNHGCGVRWVAASEESNIGSMRLVYDDSYCVIDYLFIVPYARKQGLATKLIQFAQQFAMTDGARLLLCLATEDSCSYWITRGFCLKANEEERLNPYSDTYLLSLTQCCSNNCT